MDVVVIVVVDVVTAVISGVGIADEDDNNFSISFLLQQS